MMDGANPRRAMKTTSVFPWQVHRENLIVPRTERWAKTQAGWRGRCSHGLQHVRPMLEPGKAICNRMTAVREGRVQPRNKEHPGKKTDAPGTPAKQGAVLP